MAIKTVICPACQAEQAIMREEDGTMKCAFCGEVMDLPEYEEGEEMDYSYEDEVAQPQQEKVEALGDPIDSVFVLNETEVGNAFDLSGKVRERKWIIYIELLVFVGVGLFYLYKNIETIVKQPKGIPQPGFAEWLLVAVCAAMIPTVFLLPKRAKKKLIRKSTSGNQLELTIYENLINVHVAGHDEADDWQLLLDGTFGVINQKELFVLTLQNGQIMAIPHRSLTDEQIPVVEQRLNTAYSAKEEDE